MYVWGPLGDFWQALTSDVGIETLKTLFDGILGASVGAFVAVIVLKRTLREQRRGLAVQLQAQEDHLSRQLKVQEEALAEELHAQRTENTLQRQRDVAAEIIGLLMEIHAASKMPNNSLTINTVGNSLIVNVTRLRLDCLASEEVFCNVLLEWVDHLTRCALRINGEPKPWTEEEEFTEVTQMQRSHVINLLTDWCRGEHESRMNIAEIMEASLKVEKDLGGRAWRLQVARHTLAGAQ